MIAVLRAAPQEGSCPQPAERLRQANDCLLKVYFTYETTKDSA